MKKLGTLLLAGILGAAVLTGCGAKEEDTDAEMNKVRDAGAGQQPIGGSGDEGSPEAGLPLPGNKSSGGGGG